MGAFKGSRSQHTRSSLLQPAAHPHGSLTPAETPLSDAENLFREPGPLQTNTPSIVGKVGIKWGHLNSDSQNWDDAQWGNSATITTCPSLISGALCSLVRTATT